MILSPLAQLGRYAGLHPLFPAALRWLDERRHEALADGRHELQPGLVVIAESGTTHDRTLRRFECHRRNIDIQVSLAGGEAMEWAPLASLALAEDFLPGGDIAFWHDPPAGAVTRLLVRPGDAAIFFPEDAHKPVLHPDAAPVAYRKLVFKVAVV